MLASHVWPGEKPRVFALSGFKHARSGWYCDAPLSGFSPVPPENELLGRDVRWCEKKPDSDDVVDLGVLGMITHVSTERVHIHVSGIVAVTDFFQWNVVCKQEPKVSMSKEPTLWED